MRISGESTKAQLTTTYDGIPLWVLQTLDSDGATLIEGKTLRQAEKNAFRYLKRSFGRTKAGRALFAEWVGRQEDSGIASWWVIPLFGAE